MLLNSLNFCKSTIFFDKNENLFKFTKRKCNWSRLHPIHAKAMNGASIPDNEVLFYTAGDAVLKINAETKKIN